MTDTRPWPDTAPQFEVHNLSVADFKNGVLVRSPNWLGDAVMTLPALMQLRKIIPKSCALAVVCPENLEEFFLSLPIIDQVITYERGQRFWNKKMRNKIRWVHFGLAVMFNNSLRDALLLKSLGIPKLYGAAARGRSFLLKRSFKFPKIKPGQLHGLQHVDRYLSIVKALGAPDWNGELPEFKLGNTPEYCPDGRLLALAPGAAYGAAKRWPSESFRTIAALWLEQGGHVLVLGSSSEDRIAGEVLDGLSSKKTLNLCGKTNMSELMALLKCVDGVVANDSGLMHLSAALGVPGVAIYGPTDWTSTSPISNSWRILFERQSCAPCFKRECPVGTAHCMTAITPTQVWDALQQTIKENCQ
ncbi:MAG: lipopolysaccharide heptosyltransferase II [Victivallaceae bacterium]|nr:lipopolysaccharide heptosyltransferase II [Victivallaceae bacterium]MDD4181009.1 lipopolysaccharide heptosyltransferase II [Victivallaceae bacterium]